MIVQRTLSLAFLLLLVSVPAADAQRGGSGVLTANGRVGSLQAGSSTLADVRRVAGAPTRRFSGEGEGGRRFTGLAYRCGRGKATTYYVDRRGRLANFTTTCRGWRTAGGTKVGMSSDEAEEREDAAAAATCGGADSIRKRGRRGAVLFVTFFQSGGLVRALAVAGRNSVLGC